MRVTSYWLWRVARSTVEPATRTGASTANGVTRPVRPTPTWIAQWVEAVERDYSHPSIVGWCPLNETHQFIHDRFTVLDDVTTALFLATKGIDRTRPVIDASGYSHRVTATDVWDSHDYSQDPEVFADRMAGLERGEPFANTGANSGEARPGAPDYSLPYAGQPYFCSEFGGIWWVPPHLRGDGDDGAEGPRAQRRAPGHPPPPGAGGTGTRRPPASLCPCRTSRS